MNGQKFPQIHSKISILMSMNLEGDVIKIPTGVMAKSPNMFVHIVYLDMVEVTSSHNTSSETKLLEKDWTLFHSGIAISERLWAGAGLLMTP